MGSEYYFSSGILKGLGKLFYLRVPQVAAAGSAPARLIGSIVREGHGGLFGGSEYPVPENSFILGAVLAATQKLLSLTDDEMVNEVDLAGFSQTVKIDRSAAGKGEANFPGAPMSAGIGVDYKRVQSVDLSFGSGARKRFIPRDLLIDGYRQMAKKSDDYPPAFFDHDRMVIDQVVIVRDLTVTVNSSTDFSGNFHERAEQTNQLGIGVTYERKSATSYALKLEGGVDYLFGVGAVEADKFVR